MCIFRSRLGLLLPLLLAAGTASADNNFGIGVKAGTLGLGLEASWQPLPYLELRVGANSYDYADNGSQAGINYDATLALESYYGTASFHFPISPMRVTAGIYSNGNELLMLNEDLQDKNIGGIVYPGTDIGTLQSTTSFSSSLTTPTARLCWAARQPTPSRYRLRFHAGRQGRPESRFRCPVAGRARSRAECRWRTRCRSRIPGSARTGAPAIGGRGEQLQSLARRLAWIRLQILVSQFDPAGATGICRI